MYLLDVNVLIALLDPIHEHRQKVTDWYLKHQRRGWATCPLTENGFIRIFGYVRSFFGSVSQLSPSLAGFNILKAYYPNGPTNPRFLNSIDSCRRRA